MNGQTLNYITIGLVALFLGVVIGFYLGWNAGWDLASSFQPEGLRGVYFNETAARHCSMNVSDRVAQIYCPGNTSWMST